MSGGVFVLLKIRVFCLEGVLSGEAFVQMGFVLHSSMSAPRNCNPLQEKIDMAISMTIVVVPMIIIVLAIVIVSDDPKNSQRTLYFSITSACE